MKTLSKFFAIGLVISLFSACGTSRRINPATHDEVLGVIHIVDDWDVEVFEILNIVDDDIVVETIRGWGDDTAVETINIVEDDRNDNKIIISRKVSVGEGIYVLEDEVSTLADGVGVIINNIKWATRNVGTPGTFVRNQEDTGMLFQWNRRNGWNTTGNRLEDWDNSVPIGTAWYAENDPCPEGWRVPTREEFQSLINADVFWARKNGINGYIIGTAPNQIFLPKSYSLNNNGGLIRAMSAYWSGTQVENEYDGAHLLWLNGLRLWLETGRGAVIFNFQRASAFSIRCVAK